MEMQTRMRLRMRYACREKVSADKAVRLVAAFKRPVASGPALEHQTTEKRIATPTNQRKRERKGGLLSGAERERALGGRVLKKKFAKRRNKIHSFPYHHQRVVISLYSFHFSKLLRHHLLRDRKKQIKQILNTIQNFRRFFSVAISLQFHLKSQNFSNYPQLIQIIQNSFYFILFHFTKSRRYRFGAREEAQPS